MAQYKVIQDIEAEDKLLGPLSLRQFIYSVIVVVLGFIAFRLAILQWFLVIPFLPPILFFGLLAAPFGRDQSSEVWLLAKIKYFIFPRKRIWNQDGTFTQVTITVPKLIEKHYTKDFDKDEAKSRLKALATTMDTRGWAIKNVATNGYINPGQQGTSNRLLDIQQTPQDDLAAVKPTEDVLDSVGNPLAQTFTSMQNQSQQVHRQAILQKMQSIADQQKAAQAKLAPTPQPVMQPRPAAPVVQTPAPAAPQPVQQPVTQPPAPAILKEVKSPEPPSELRVKNTSATDGESGEVVISLH